MTFVETFKDYGRALGCALLLGAACLLLAAAGGALLWLGAKWDGGWLQIVTATLGEALLLASSAVLLVASIAVWVLAIRTLMKRRFGQR